jgi:TetR/AcrR family transcriptional regulator, transcriptional repressor for nem operon
MLASQNRRNSGKGAARDPVRTRGALLQAAFEEIHRSGFRGSDVESILRKAGMTKGALYHHFASKEALGYAILDEVVASIMREKWQAPLSDAADPVAALIDIIRSTSLEREHVVRGCPLNNLAQEMSPLDEGFRKRAAALFEEWHVAMATALRAARERGQVRADVDPDETATFVIAAYEGYISLAKCFQDADRLRAGEQTLIRYLESLRPSDGGRKPRRAG